MNEECVKMLQYVKYTTVKHVHVELRILLCGLKHDNKKCGRIDVTILDIFIISVYVRGTMNWNMGRP